MLPQPSNRHPWNSWDHYVLGALLFFTAWFLHGHAQWKAVPMEDSLMLLRYARHLAQGHGIVWNVGEHPVEGATDFFYMFSVALTSRVTQAGEILSGRLLIAAAHLGSVAVLYVGARKLFGWPVYAALCLALYLAVDIARGYISTGFGAPFYAFFALAAWYIALSCIGSQPPTRRGYALGAMLLLTALTRPDGIFMDMFILIAVVLAQGRAALRVVLSASVTLFVLGAAYFVWRFHYFGYLLPNPFYLKGGGHLYPASLTASIQNTLQMLLPFIPLIALELFSRNYRRALIVMLPTFGFTCIWILLSNQNNALMRFQYCGIPIALLSIPFATTTLRERLAKLAPGVMAQIGLVAVTLLLSVKYWNSLIEVPPVGSGPYNVASQLSRFQDRNYVLATTEAGAFPYFSQWRAVDLYGLNDPAIVHNAQRLTEAYLVERNPAIVIYHMPPLASLWPSFTQILNVTRAFVASHPYALAASWGQNPCDREYFFVRKDLPETDEFIRIIRQAHPFFLDTGLISYDFRDMPYPDQCSDAPLQLKSSE